MLIFNSFISLCVSSFSLFVTFILLLFDFFVSPLYASYQTDIFSMSVCFLFLFRQVVYFFLLPLCLSFFLLSLKTFSYLFTFSVHLKWLSLSLFPSFSFFLFSLFFQKLFCCCFSKLSHQKSILLNVEHKRGAATLTLTTLWIMTLSIMIQHATLNVQCSYAPYHYDERR
jgi:hypothetical protein